MSEQTDEERHESAVERIWQDAATGLIIEPPDEDEDA